MPKSLNVLNVTCFKFHSDNKINCKNQKCRQWINYTNGSNCTILTAKNGPVTLETIGEILGGLSRMRICQIQNDIEDKIRTTIL